MIYTSTLSNIFHSILPAFLSLAPLFHELTKIFVEAMYFMLLGYSLKYMSFSGPDMTIGLSINGCLHPKNQLDEVKQGWLVQTFALQRAAAATKVWKDSDRASLSPRRSITRQKKALLAMWVYPHLEVCQFQKFLSVAFLNSHSTGTSCKVVLDQFQFQGNYPPTPPLTQR